MDVNESNKTKEEIEEFTGLTMPVVKFIRDHFDPHTKVIIDMGGVEVMQGLIGIDAEYHEVHFEPQTIIPPFSLSGTPKI